MVWFLLSIAVIFFGYKRLRDFDRGYLAALLLSMNGPLPIFGLVIIVGLILAIGVSKTR